MFTTQALILGFVGIAMVTAALAVVGVPLGRLRRPYYLGLVTALGAYVVAVVATFTILHFASVDVRFVNIVLPPIVEETFRVAAVFGAASLFNSKRAWVAFAFGYALLESSGKLGDFFVAFTRGMEGFESPVLLATPLVPLALHVFLSLSAIPLMKRRVSPFAVFFVLAALHAFHNWSVFFVWAPQTETDMAVMVAVRTSLFLLLIGGVLWLGRAGPVTSPAPHANSGA